MDFKKLARLFAAVMAIVCLLTMGVGCGKDPDKTSDGEGDKEKTFHLRWFQESRGQDPAKDRLLKEIQKRNNITIEFVTAPAGQEREKLNLMVSTGEKLDLVTLFDVDKIAVQWAMDDHIYSFDDIIKNDKYPSIKAILDADMYKHLRVNNKAYFKPQPLWPGLRGYIIRKDWLDNVGLGMPTTIDEFYEVIKAFRHNDPDKNGKHDTYGFFVAEPTGTNSFGYIARAFASCGGWGGDWTELADGSITQFGVSDASKKAFKFIKKCYDEDLFNKSFVNEKDAHGKVEDLMVQNKLGMTDNSQPANVENRFREAGVKAQLAYLPPLNRADGSSGTLPHTGGYWSHHIIPKTCKDVNRVLDLLEWALTPEGRELTMFGIKGTHFSGYTVNGNNRIYDINKAEMDKDWNTSDYGTMHPLAWGGFNYCEGMYLPLSDFGYKLDEAFKNLNRWMTKDASEGVFVNWYSENAKYAKQLPLQGVIADEVQVDQKLIDIEIQGRTKCIVEDVSKFDKNWQEWVDKWMNAGGRDLIRRANDYYKANK